MTWKPTPAEAIWHNAILEQAVQDNAEAVQQLILAYYEGDPIAVMIGLADPHPIRAEYVNGPGTAIRIEYGAADEHDHFIIIEPGTPGEQEKL